MVKKRKVAEKFKKFKGDNIQILAIEWSNDSFEIAVFNLDKNYTKLEMITVYNLQDCEFYFNKFIKKYTTKKEIKKFRDIPKKYLKFAQDYKMIYDLCKDYFYQNPIIDDSGISNFDCVTVSIGSRVKKGFLIAALKPYKLKATITENIIYLSVPYMQYQGLGRTKQAEFMYEKFKQLDYICDMYYRID